MPGAFPSGPSRANINAAPWQNFTPGAQQFAAPWLGMGYTPGFQGTYGDWSRQNPGMGTRGVGAYMKAKQGQYTPGAVNVGQYGQQYMKDAGFGTRQPSALQQQVGNTYANMLSQPTYAERTLGDTKNILMQLASGQQNLLDPLQKAHAENQAIAGANLLQGGLAGGRFGSGAQRALTDSASQGNRDWLNFAAPLQQQSIANQMAAAGMLGQMGSAADASRYNLAGGAGQYGNALEAQQIQQNQFLNQATLQQMQMMQQLALGAGGINTPAVINPGNPGWLPQLAGTAAGFAMGGFNPFGGGAQQQAAGPYMNTQYGFGSPGGNFFGGSQMPYDFNVRAGSGFRGW